MPGRAPPALDACLRVVSVVVGGYVATSGLISLGAIALPLVFAMRRADAVILMSALGCLLYPAIGLWVAVQPDAWRLLLLPSALAGAGFGLAALVSLAGG